MNNVELIGEAEDVVESIDNLATSLDNLAVDIANHSQTVDELIALTLCLAEMCRDAEFSGPDNTCPWCENKYRHAYNCRYVMNKIDQLARLA